MVVRRLCGQEPQVRVPAHLIDRGIEAIIRRREAETGLRFTVLARPDHAHPVKAATATHIDGIHDRESEAA